MPKIECTLYCFIWAGEPPNSIIANEFYSNILDQKDWWAAELENEGMMLFDLPQHPETDGRTLRNMATHGATFAVSLSVSVDTVYKRATVNKCTILWIDFTMQFLLGLLQGLFET